MAGVTERIKLGIAVLCLPFRNPIIAAKQVANIDVLSGRPVIWGISVGAGKSTHNVDFEVLGVSRVDKYDKTKDYLPRHDGDLDEPQTRVRGAVHLSCRRRSSLPKPAAEAGTHRSGSAAAATSRSSCAPSSVAGGSRLGSSRMSTQAHRWSTRPSDTAAGC